MGVMLSGLKYLPVTCVRRLVGILLFFWGLGLSSLLRAQTVSDTESTTAAGSYQASNPAAGIEEVAFSLAIVLVLIFVLAWLVKRFAPGAARMGSRDMQVLSTLALGGKERIMLVDVAGTQMVLGVSPAGIECLHVFPEPVIEKQQSAGSSDVHFAKLLQSFKADRDKG